MKISPTPPATVSDSYTSVHDETKLWGIHNFIQSYTVATWSKASCLGSMLQDVQWFESCGERNFLREFQPVYGTGANPASWGIWEATIDRESLLRRPAIIAGAGDVLTLRPLYTSSVIFHSLSEDIRGREARGRLVSQGPIWAVALWIIWIRF